ncbi:hypothetical protein TrST_g1947 [Triparma strigata]|uniref:RanBP2-type domain-containing protein n=1 Tax=Triparma strigata TaxID=1606541 RepID=A0A9W7EKP3_9STRA|nr:hypothetical protein TrST_g1947 [Triparma strigata]
MADPAEWTCRTCTLVNEWASDKCLACERPRPHASTVKTKKTTPAKSKSKKVKVIELSDSEDSDKGKPKAKKKKLRQAKESTSGEVTILCYSCRHDPSHSKQSSLGSFLSSPPSRPPSKNQCSRCLKELHQASRGSSSSSSSTTGALPHIERLKSYKRQAKDGEVPFELTDSQAMEIMRRDCSLCGAGAGTNGQGITRLRIWPERLLPAREQCLKPYMGPFCVENCAAACSTCNQMKGARRMASFVFACRHLATKNCDPPRDFGLYPEFFSNNISKRSRSSYISNSSTHTKTHSLTNEEFNDITSKPCFYCKKEPSPSSDPPHYNGLDRLDSDDRVYSVDSVVSCCGDCNLMKYVHTVDFFLSHVKKVAEFNVGVEFTADSQFVKVKSVKDILREKANSKKPARSPIPRPPLKKVKAAD